MRYAPKKVFILENSVQFLSFRLCYRFLALFSNLIFFYLLGLPVHSQKGLIGELLYLADLIDKYNEDIALNSWVGPDGCDQDYNFEIGWSEIKTTIISGTSIQVSSLQQLDRTDKGQLIVYFLDRTTSCGNNTISLDEVIAQIMSKIKLYNNKNLFAIKLAKNINLILIS